MCPGYFLKNADVYISETPPPLESANVCNWVPPPPLKIADVLCGRPLVDIYYPENRVMLIFFWLDFYCLRLIMGF